MNRATIRCVGLVTALVTLLPATSAVAAPQRCDELQGKVKVRTAKIKVVEQRVDDRRLDGRRLLGCTLPRGRVFTVAQAGTPKRSDINVVSYELGAKAGRFLEVRRFYGDGIAQIQDSERSVLNLADGRRRRFYEGAWGESICGGTEGETSQSTPPVARVVLRPNGYFAVLYSSPEGREECFPNEGRSLLLGFPTGQARITLDLAPVADLPPESVRISGTTFHWTTAGEARSDDAYN